MIRRVLMPVTAVAGVALAAAALLGAASSFAAPAGRHVAAGSEVRVPQLIGLSRDRAAAHLRGRHLHPLLKGTGKVVSQRPVAGTLVRPGTIVAAHLRLPRHGGGAPLLGGSSARTPRRLPVAPLLVTLGIATALAADFAMARRSRSLAFAPAALVNVERDKLSRVG